jgi:quinol monooxygenase YgiN
MKLHSVMNSPCARLSSAILVALLPLILLLGSAKAAGEEPRREEIKCCAVFELRQYTLHPGQRDTLIELFDREFVESQEAVGMRIYGQFRDADQPDRFVWVRGFANMEVRKQALASFYGGATWKAHGKAAAATMIDSDNVLLLRSVDPQRDFDDLPKSRPPIDAVEPGSLVEATVYGLRPEARARFLKIYRERMRPALLGAGIVPRAAFSTLHAPNTYPALPVREGEEVFVWFASFQDDEASASSHEKLSHLRSWLSVQAELAACLTSPPQQLRLRPTGRSLLR